MAMLSLKRFFDVGDEDLALRKVVFLLLEKISQEAVQSDIAERDAFRAEMNELRERAAQNSSPDAMFITAGSAAQAMTIYNRHVSAFLHKQTDELHSIISMVTETALTIGGESTVSAQRLQEIGDRFEKAGALDDLPALKAHLSDCLHSFREETERQKAESHTAIQSLQREVERRSTTAANSEIDSVTGLPRMATGLQTMEEAAKSGKRLYVLAMVVKGVQAVNARFGFSVGDRMLRVFKENVEKQLFRADKLFRWEGPAIVVLLERTEPIEQVRAQIRRILDTRLEESFNVTGGRSVMIPISVSWFAFSLMPPLADAAKQIQTFIVTQGCRE